MVGVGLLGVGIALTVSSLRAPDDAPGLPGPSGPAPTLRGVNFAHEGYGGFDGYLTERSDASLGRLAEMGANAVAILPYTSMPSAHRPVPLVPPTRPGSETDEAVSHAIRTAMSHGMTVLLKPHIWVRGSWPGEIRMHSPEDWDGFFRSYEDWILHYARMAEAHGVALLSVGVELTRATLGHEARWIHLVERVREEYSGALVYAANWGEEVENLEFWHAFDYIGVDLYYPLSDAPDATDAMLRRGAEAVLDRIERVHAEHDRPVLVTEVGFASTRAPWLRPWESHRQEESSHEDQARSYRVMTEAMAGRPWIEGVFWWKWPSDPRRVDRYPRGFKPMGKPAEAVLEEWFGQGVPAADTP